MIEFEAFKDLPPQVGTFLVATLPLGELRGAIPFAAKFYPEMSAISMYIWAVLGNLFPVIFILIGLEKLSDYLTKKSKTAKRFFDWLFTRTRKKLEKSHAKWGYLALTFFVAIPLPVTGAWTGAIAAYVFGIPKKQAFMYITFGVLIAGVIVLSITEGVAMVF